MKRLLLFHRRWWWGAASLPGVALVNLGGNRWAAVDGGATEPDGYMVSLGSGRFAVDDTVSTGLELSMVGNQVFATF